jgi:predicted MFS family arabinose efflux permease
LENIKLRNQIESLSQFRCSFDAVSNHRQESLFFMSWHQPPSVRYSLMTVLVCSGLIVSLSMGIRHAFGFWQVPMVQAHGWSREAFSFAIALQNLVWGLSQPFVGVMADRIGAAKVLLAGALLYALGLLLMTFAQTGASIAVSAGVVVGVALSCTTYSVVYGVIGRTADPSQRSQAMGIAAAAGSFGQFAMVPGAQALIDATGWQAALWLLAAAALVMAPLSLGLREPKDETTHAVAQSASQAAAEALRDPSFLWLITGYFVCGFQVVFIAAHMPAYLKDLGFEPKVAVWALALIGLFNVAGTYLSGHAGARVPKKWLLSGIYFARAVVIAIFVLLPVTPMSVYVFSAVMGFLWLSTVPLTGGVIATIFGVRYLGMLSGVAFLSHQVGSFAGVWLGGWLYDRLGNYNLVWWISIALGVLAGFANLPIRERAIVRVVPVAA